jgi:hypothetical protein
MQTVTTIGLDIAKSVFQVHGIDAAGQVVIRRQLKRRYVLAFFEKLPPCLVGIEACASSHYWSRELQALGHTVRYPSRAQADRPRGAVFATMTTASKPKRAPIAMNGVDTPKLLATIQAVGAQPELAKFRFRAQNRWISGTGNETTMHGFYGAGGEHVHLEACTAIADHPAVLCGADRGPTPVEWLLHALVSCLMSGIGNIAAARSGRSFTLADSKLAKRRPHIYRPIIHQNNLICLTTRI